MEKTILDYQLVARALDYLRGLGQDITGPLPQEPRYRLMLWSDYSQRALPVPFSSGTLVQRARIYKVLRQS